MQNNFQKEITLKQQSPESAAEENSITSLFIM